MRLDGKIAAVTGGAQGLGLATARRLAAEGATVFVCDLNAAEGKAAAQRISEESGFEARLEPSSRRPGAWISW
jgi:NAD(P)-dependent dehydrogenase (short-subunit alcohol dehydrogenase family)